MTNVSTKVKELLTLIEDSDLTAEDLEGLIKPKASKKRLPTTRRRCKAEYDLYTIRHIYKCRTCGGATTRHQVVHVMHFGDYEPTDVEVAVPTCPGCKDYLRTLAQDELIALFLERVKE